MVPAFLGEGGDVPVARAVDAVELVLSDGERDRRGARASRGGISVLGGGALVLSPRRGDVDAELVRLVLVARVLVRLVRPGDGDRELDEVLVGYLDGHHGAF